MMLRYREQMKVLALIEVASVAGQTTLVAIDGLGGAGKSTLATQLAEASKQAAVVRMDDFYLPIGTAERAELSPRDGYELYFDWQQLRHTVLTPLSKGSHARYRRHDWATNGPAEWHEVKSGQLVVAEGVYSTRPELRPYYAVTVYVDTPRERRLERMLSRNYEDPSWIEHWMAAEDWYEEHEQPDQHADLVINGS